MINAESYFLIVLAVIWIIIAIIQDFRKREVANWLNFSLIAIALAYRAFVSVFFENYLYFINGLLGFAIFFLLANLFYYGRVFAGGDAKLLMGLGAVLPFSFFLYENLQIFLYFIILLLFTGSIYGLTYSFVLSYKNRKKFIKEFFKQFDKNKKVFKIFIFLAALVLIFVLFMEMYLFVWFSLIVLIFPFLYIYAKAIEESCMVRSKHTRELTLGDWLYKPVKVGKKRIKPNWEGLSDKELKILKKVRRKVLVKEGIPFTPSFLLAFLILVWFLKKGMMELFYSLGI